MDDDQQAIYAQHQHLIGLTHAHKWAKEHHAELEQQARLEAAKLEALNPFIEEFAAAPPVPSGNPAGVE